MSDTEVLEVGEERRRRPSPRVRLVLLVVVLALLATAYVVDRWLREREERAVQRCADEVATAVDFATRSVRSAYEYVRPSLGVPLAPSLEAGIFRVIAKSAQGADAELDSPVATCTGFTVLPFHDDLQARRDSCLDVLTSQRRGLADVAADGRSLRAWMYLPRRC